MEQEKKSKRKEEGRKINEEVKRKKKEGTLRIMNDEQ